MFRFLSQRSHQPPQEKVGINPSSETGQSSTRETILGEQTPLLPSTVIQNPMGIPPSLSVPSGDVTFASDTTDNTGSFAQQHLLVGVMAAPPSTTTRQLFHSVSTLSSRIWNDHFGQIGIVGSTSIAVNFLTGPAMLELPSLYQKAGIIPTSLTIVLVGTLSTLGSLHLARVISQIPGNANFEQPIEYSDVFHYYFLRAKVHHAPPTIPSTTNTTTTSSTTTSTNTQRAGRLLVLATQIAFFACITSLNISSMVDSAQVMDSILANPQFVGQTLALEYRGGWGARQFLQLTFWNYRACHEQQNVEGECIPFTNYNPDVVIDSNDDTDANGTVDGCILSLGYLLTLVCFLPLSLMDLQENAAWQVVEFVVLIITSVIFGFLFWNTGLNPDNVSWWGESWDGLLGVILFNFALVISISSWLHEKEPHVDARQVIVGSTTLAGLLYMTLGILGAMAIPQVSPNMLESFLSGTFGPAMQYTASVFALFIVGLGIPLLCVLCRLNLKGGSSTRGMSERHANWLAVYLPFGISWMFYKGDSVTQLLSWGGTICTSLIAFVFPWLVALQALRVLGGGFGGNGDGSGSSPSHYYYPGTIEVYGDWWRSKSSFGRVSSDGNGKPGGSVMQTERRILWSLLFLSLVCIACAIVGNLVQYE